MANAADDDEILFGDDGFDQLEAAGFLDFGRGRPAQQQARGQGRGRPAQQQAGGQPVRADGVHGAIKSLHSNELNILPGLLQGAGASENP